MIHESREYDPVNFIEKNINLILPENSILKEITFSGYIKRRFHTNNRPNGIVTIVYQKNNKENEIKLFLKQHENAKKVFDHMQSIYQKLDDSQANKHIPKPIICDNKQNANYMECFKGYTLKYTLFHDIALGRKKKITLLFNDIGHWLSIYHKKSKVQSKFKVKKIKKNVQKTLEKSIYFNENEKEKISTLLNEINFKKKTLSFITPHNDFALRNIICIKSGGFVVIDWDAAFHEKFPTEAPIWHDITSFFINVLSFSRFYPVIRSSTIKELINSFIEGYFRDNTKFDKEDINHFLYLYSLSYYLGIIGDRPLPEIYKTKLGSKFIKSLHKKFITGSLI